MAARTPRTRARTADIRATWIEVQSALSHSDEEKNLSYHWSDQPGGGNLNVLELEKLIGTTTRVGNSNQAETIPIQHRRNTLNPRPFSTAVLDLLVMCDHLCTRDTR